MFIVDKDTTLLTAAEVAAWLRVDRSTVSRWATDGKIPTVRLPGRTVRFDRGELETWLREEK